MFNNVTENGTSVDTAAFNLETLNDELFIT